MDGKRALSRKESKEKLRQIAQRLGDQEALKNVVERYSAEVARIESVQKRDKIFLEALKVFLPHARTLYTMRDPNDTHKQMNLADIAIHLTAIALVHKNLTEDALIDYIVACAKAAVPQGGEMSAAKSSEVTKQLRSDLSRYLVQSPNISPQELGPKLFGRALTALTPRHLSKESDQQSLFHRRSTYSLDVSPTPANKPQFARLGIFGNPCPGATNVKDKMSSSPASKPVEAKQHTFPRMSFLGNSCATAVNKAKAAVVSTISPEPTRGLVK
jgi:hypothetical protein